jgi:hypothetical protein
MSPGQRLAKHHTAMAAKDSPKCSINLCPNPSAHQERIESKYWRFTVHYCREHHRELEKGTPLGPLGLDCSHITIEPMGESELKVPSKQPAPSA